MSRPTSSAGTPRRRGCSGVDTVRIPGLELEFDRLPAPLPIWRASVDADAWQVAARAVAAAGGRLVALWGADRGRREAGGFAVCAAYALADGLAWLDLQLDANAPAYPDLSAQFPCAVRMQRAAADLLGIVAIGARDTRPWLDHGAWPADRFPLHEQDAESAVGERTNVVDYPFVRVAGDGVHEIPVGPVHAGVIEPGHFRFSIVGEKVLRLEQRLGYTHKGIDRRFEDFTVAEGYRLAGRVSGDSTVAYAWAYAQAAEAAAGIEPPARARWLRALLLERERIANHLGDLGALGNDGGFAFALSQFMRLKEDWLRANGEAFGHRFAMDAIVPGGVAVDPDPAKLAAMARHAHEIEIEVHGLRDIFDEHSGLQDRF